MASQRRAATLHRPPPYRMAALEEQSIIRSCIGKTPWATWEIADEKRREYQERRGRPLRVYRCPAGPHFHLASQPKFASAQSVVRCGRCLEAFTPETIEQWQCVSCQAGGRP